jgi:hypothetical protein
MPTLAQRAKEHEGELQGPSNSHISVYRDHFAHFTNPADPANPQAQWEKTVWRTTSFEGQTDEEFVQMSFQKAVASPAALDPRQHHYDPTTTQGGPTADVPLAIFPCYLRY